MSLLSRSERSSIELLSQLTFTNPFLPERIALEKKILGRRYHPEPFSAWSLDVDQPRRKNIRQIHQRIEALAQTIRKRIVSGQHGDDVEYELYDDLVMHLLYFRLDEALTTAGDLGIFRAAATWKQFEQDFQFFLHCGEFRFPRRDQPEHVFAGIYQVHRAFHNIFLSVLGRSPAAIELRASIWQSIFTHDIRRHQRSLYQHMSRVPTLIAGPSGTGKELVASAIGRSRYCPFDSKKLQFAAGGGEDYHSLHLAALPVTLVESELFGHAKGSFTGASRDRAGWLETVGPHGAVFLDEIGEVDPQVQTKLLRVLQTRQFQRIGEQTSRNFAGKLIAATNRDLRLEIARGSFRQDLYFRLCGDLVQTPSLREQLREAPDDLAQFVRFIALQLAPSEPDSIVKDSLEWIERHLPADYPWPGNFRELEQCVRNIVIHNAYDFSGIAQTALVGKLGGTLNQMESLTIQAEELLCRYCTYAYWKTRTFESAAELLGLDRRTLRGKLDSEFLKQLDRSHAMTGTSE
jgi:DNA-binding NtrC family response regulator